MTATSHALIGTVIAAKFGNPALSVPIALASHVIADSIPHWDIATNGSKKDNEQMFNHAMIDVTIGFVLSYFLAYFLFPDTSLGYIFLIIIASQFFDWLTMPYRFFCVKKPPLFYWTYKFQKLFDSKLNKPWGVITQTIFVISVILIGSSF